MPTPISITPDEINVGPQAVVDFVNEQDIGNPNIVLGVREVNITGTGGGGGGSARPTSGMIYPRGIC